MCLITSIHSKAFVYGESQEANGTIKNPEGFVRTKIEAKNALEPWWRGRDGSVDNAFIMQT